MVKLIAVFSFTGQETRLPLPIKDKKSAEASGGRWGNFTVCKV